MILCLLLFFLVEGEPPDGGRSLTIAPPLQPFKPTPQLENGGPVLELDLTDDTLLERRDSLRQNAINAFNDNYSSSYLCSLQNHELMFDYCRYLLKEKFKELFRLFLVSEVVIFALSSMPLSPISHTELKPSIYYILIYLF